MPDNTPKKKKKIPKHVYRLIKFFAKELIKLAEKYDINVLVMLESKNHFFHDSAGPVMGAYEGRIDELHDVILKDL